MHTSFLKHLQWPFRQFGNSPSALKASSNGTLYYYIEQVRLLCTIAPVGLMILLIFSLTLLYIERGMKGGIWFGIEAIITVFQLALLLSFKRVSGDYTAVKRWFWIFLMGIILSGIIWGIAPFLFVPDSRMIQRYLLVFFMAGAGACAAGVYFPRPWATLAFIIPVYVPSVIRVLLIQRDVWRISGVIIFLYGLVLIILSQVLRRAFTVSLSLKAENARLKETITTVEQLNRVLEAEIEGNKKALDVLQISEEKFSKAFYNGPDVYILSSFQNGTILEVNNAFFKYTGYKEEEVIGKKLTDLQLGYNEETRKQLIEELLKKDSVQNYELSFTTKEGITGTALLSSSIIQFREEQYIISTARDITEIKKAVQVLDQRLAAMEASRDGIAIFNENREYIYVNKAYVSIFGYDSNEDFICRSMKDFYTIEGWERYDAEEKTQLADVGHWSGECTGMRRDGTLFPLEVSRSVIKGGNLICIVRDIAQRRQAEERLKLKEERYFLATSAAKVGVWDWNLLTNEIYAEHKNKLMGYNGEPFPESFIKFIVKDDFLGTLTNCVNFFFHPDDREMVLKKAFNHIEGKTPGTSFEVRITYRDGSKHWLLINGTTIRDEQGKVIRIIGTTTDITEQKQTQDALWESEERLKNIVENVRDIIFQIAPGGIILYISPNIEALYGYKPDEVIGRNFEMFIPEEELPKLQDMRRRLTEAGLVRNFEFNIKTKNGYIVHTEINITLRRKGKRIIAAQGILRDISERKEAELERKKLEEQLYRAQMMESIGRLAGGIAHDFNNILSIVMGYTDLLRLQFSNTDTSEGKAVNIIFKNVKRASDLTRQLLGLARGTGLSPKPLNINKELINIVKLSEKIFEKNIEIIYRLASNLYCVEADLYRISQVFTNILINARDAMPVGGSIVIKTENVTLTKKTARIFPELEPGHYVLISITDTGVGIAPEDMPHIFEPLFTRKIKGTGLGLSTAYRIIRDHKGTISVESNLGAGATFTVYFPACSKEITPEETEEAIIRGKDTILIVDDEEDVNKLVSEMLEMLGYRTLQAKNGEDALKIYKANRDTIDLVMLDMIMPVMSGYDTFFALQKINPDVRVLLMSGYSENNKTMKILDSGGCGFLPKPFEINRLSESIAHALKIEIKKNS
jgi:PAS domain S-box-containing protein